jgi:integrase
VLRIPRGKTANSRRAVELSQRTTDLLREHRQRQRELRLRRGLIWSESGLVFPSSTGTRWEANNFYRAYKQVVGRSGISEMETVKWHTLRHTATTHWLMAGADIYSVSRRLGHVSAAFTLNVYGHLLKGMQRQAAEAVDHLIG